MGDAANGKGLTKSGSLAATGNALLRSASAPRIAKPTPVVKDSPEVTVVFLPGESGLRVDGAQVTWSSGQAWMKGARPGWMVKAVAGVDITPENEGELQFLIKKAEAGDKTYKVVFHKGRNKFGIGAMQVSKLDLERETNFIRVNKEFRFQGYIQRVEHRGVTGAQLDRVVDYADKHCANWKDQAPSQDASPFFGKTLHMDFFNFHHASSWILGPATENRRCAFVELLSSRRQVPEFCISHWWGMPLADFVKAVKLHMNAHGLSADKSYWVSAFALKQHADQEQSEIGTDAAQSSFHRALSVVDFNVLFIVDAHGTVFKRTWCAYEVSMCLADIGKPFDIAVCQYGSQHVLTHGLTLPEETMEAKKSFSGVALKSSREEGFPMEIVAKAMDITVQHTVTSNEEDRARILNYFSGSALGSKPHEEHHLYEEMNKKLRAFFAAHLLRRAAVGPEAGSDLFQEIWSKISHALQQDVWRTSLDWHLQGFSTQAMPLLLQSFPPKVSNIILKFKSSFINDDDLEALVAALCKHPTMGHGKIERKILMDFRNCEETSEEDLPRFDPLKELGVVIGLDLTEPFKGCGEMLGKAVGSVMNASLVRDGADFHRYKQVVVPAVPLLIKSLLKESDPLKRKAAARALGGLGLKAREALAALKEAESNDAEESVKAVCTIAKNLIFEAMNK